MPVSVRAEAIHWSGGGAFPLLRGVSFTVERGEILVIGGRSGSGRSTLLEICAGLVQPVGGYVMWDGVRLESMTRKKLLAARERIGFLFQQHALIANYSIFDNIALPLRTQGALSEREVDMRVRSVMEEVALFGVERLFPESLSSGQLKSASLARALATDPEMLFLDEPLSGIDPQTAAGIRSVLISEQRGKPRTIITISHEIDMWAPLNYRILQMEDGMLVAPGDANLSMREAEVR